MWLVYLQEWQRELLPDQQEAVIFNSMREHLKAEQEALADIAAAIPCLQLNLIALACIDPGPRIASRLIFPALRERIEAEAGRFEANQADSALTEPGHAKVTLYYSRSFRLRRDPRDSSLQCNGHMYVQ